MSQKKHFFQGFTNQIPVMGILCFVILYIHASTLYPGGSQHDLTTVGFDWRHNYWCNLMSTQAMNGQKNPAKPYAILAMIILCVSLSIFFIQFANAFSPNRLWKKTIKIDGILSMAFATFIFTAYHDIMTILSSLFGFFVVLGIIRTLYKSSLSLYKTTGTFCILLLAANNYIYYSHHYLEILPLLQKLTFAIVLLWIIGLSYEINIILKKVPPN